MRSAAHAFAMRVEDERGDIVETVGIHGLGQSALKAFDREAGRDLPDETPCIGKARLDRDAALFARIIAIIGLGEQEVEETSAMLGAVSVSNKGDTSTLSAIPNSLAK